MDTNEIDLDDFDKSDISSDWNSSDDEAPTMEVEEDKPSTKQVQQQDKMNYTTEMDELEGMENEDDPNYIPKTKNEIEESSIEVEPINVVLDNSAFLVKCGVVYHILDDSYIIDAGKNSKAIEENSIVFKKNLQPIGRITEVLGQVEHPFYVMRWPKTMENPNLAISDEVYMNLTNAQYILPAQLNCVGTDASNVYDEEPNEKERVFIECTEDVVNNEVVDESGYMENEVNYQQEFVIPTDKRGNFHGSRVVKQPPTSIQNPFMSLMPPTQPQQTQNDTSGMDILRNSYF